MEQARRPVAGDIYRHFKDHLYEVIAIAIHSETEEEMVVYRQMYGEFKTYVRGLSMFLSEVDHEKYPNVKQKYRFELVRETKEKEAADDFLMKFLDAQSCTDKLALLEEREKQRENDDSIEPLTNSIINNMAISLDIVIGDGTPEARTEELKDCIATMARFECSRLRNC